MRESIEIVSVTHFGEISVCEPWIAPWSMDRALRNMDPFQNGAHTTMPAWYVQRQLDYVLGAEAIVLG